MDNKLVYLMLEINKNITIELEYMANFQVSKNII